jgi:hypothetical protein
VGEAVIDEIHERGLERARRIYDAWDSADDEALKSYPAEQAQIMALAAAFQAAGDALHAEADAATEQRKRGHQSLTKDLRNAAGRLVGIAQDLLELSKLDAPEPTEPVERCGACLSTDPAVRLNPGGFVCDDPSGWHAKSVPYTPMTDPVTSDLHTVDTWPREPDGSPSPGTAEDVAAYLRGNTDALPPDLTSAERYPGEWASADVMTPGMPDPCQPIGCDSGFHLPGCTFAERDAPEVPTVTVSDLAFADPEPLHSPVRWLPPGDADRYVQTFADLATPVNPATLPDHLSWSQLTTLEDCGVKYRLQRLQAIPQQPQWANIGGTAFHTVTEAFDRGAWRAGGADLLPEIHADLIKDRWRDAFAAEINRIAAETGIEMGETGENYRAAQGGKEGYTWWLIEGERMLALYIHNRRKLDAAGRAANLLRKPLELNPVGPIFLDTERVPVIEYAYSRKIDGPTGTITVEGIIDRAYLCGDGSLLVTDLKSGRLDPETGQLGEYAWTLLELLGWNESYRHPDGPGVKIMGNFYDARKGLFTDPVDLLAAHPYEEYVYRYHAAEAARRLGVFLPRKSQWCNGCSVKYACPVGGA